MATASVAVTTSAPRPTAARSAARFRPPKPRRPAQRKRQRRLTEGEHRSDLFDLVGAPAPSNDVSATRWLVGNDPPVVAISSRRPPVATTQRDLVWHARLDTGHLVTQNGFRLVRESDLDEQVDQVVVFAKPDAAEAPARLVRRITFQQPVSLRKLYAETPWLGE